MAETTEKKAEKATEEVAIDASMYPVLTPAQQKATGRIVPTPKFPPLTLGQQRSKDIKEGKIKLPPPPPPKAEKAKPTEVMYHIEPAVTAVRHEMTHGQRLSSHFTEAPRIGGMVLRRGSVLKLTGEKFDRMQHHLFLLHKSNSIVIKVVHPDGDVKIMEPPPHFQGPRKALDLDEEVEAKDEAPKQKDPEGKPEEKSEQKAAPEKGKGKKGKKGEEEVAAAPTEPIIPPPPPPDDTDKTPVPTGEGATPPPEAPAPEKE